MDEDSKRGFKKVISFFVAWQVGKCGPWPKAQCSAGVRFRSGMLDRWTWVDFVLMIVKNRKNPTCLINSELNSKFWHSFTMNYTLLKYRIVIILLWNKTQQIMKFLEIQKQLYEILEGVRFAKNEFQLVNFRKPKLVWTEWRRINVEIQKVTNSEIGKRNSLCI